jgi:coenzyme PQQ precursor peptide PqqA
MWSRKMEWVTPEFEEINLSCEINSYVNAEL